MNSLISTSGTYDIQLLFISWSRHGKMPGCYVISQTVKANSQYRVKKFAFFFIPIESNIAKANASPACFRRLIFVFAVHVYLRLRCTQIIISYLFSRTIQFDLTPRYMLTILYFSHFIHKLTGGIYVRGMYGQRRPWSDCAFAQSDQGLCCPFTESLYIGESINEK